MYRYEQFHDGYFEGIWIPGTGTVHVFLSTSDRQQSTAVLSGVVMLKASGLKEGNIILEVGTRDGNLDDIAVLYDLGPDHEPATWETELVDKISRRFLLLFEINPSYGGECLILAKALELLDRQAWMERYVFSEARVIDTKHPTNS